MRILFIVMLLIAGCSKAPIEQRQTNNTDFKVDTLFDHDGCRVYRFKDAGKWIYYARCGRNDAIAMWNEDRTQYNAATKQSETTITPQQISTSEEP